MGATVLCLLKAFVQMLSMYKAKPEFVFGFSLIFKFYIRMPQLFFHDLQGRATDVRLLRLGALSLMALNTLLTNQEKVIVSLAKYLLLHMRSIYMENKYEQ